MPGDYSQFVPFLLAALVVFAIYRRLRRSFGRQVVRPGRMTFRIVLLTILVCTLLPLALRTPQYLAAEVIGAALGVALGTFGARRTRFQTYDGRLHYIPHTYTGVAVSLLFLGRLVYRVVQVYSASPAASAPGAGASQAFAPASMVRSPLTLGLFFVLAGYYVFFYGWVLWKSRRLKAEDIEAAPAAASPSE
jgi:hypothetical protein